MAITAAQPRPLGAPSTAAPVPAGARTLAAKPSKLSEVIRGPMVTPKRLVFYGTRGIGKSTLAADAPAPIFCDLGNATEHLNVTRYPLPAEPAYSDVLDMLDDLATAEHSFRTLVIEDVGELESLLWRHLIAHAAIDKNGERPESIEGFGYGKGYTIAEAEWRVLVHRLDQLRLRKAMHIIVLGHATIRTIKNPTGENYDRHVPLVHEKAVGVLGANADVVGFVTFDDVAKRIQSGPARKTIGITGHRVIQLEHAAAWDAKCRLPMAAMIDLPETSPWAPFGAAIHQLHSMSPAALRTQLEIELTRLGATFTKPSGTPGSAVDVRAAVTKAGDDVSALFKYLTTLQQASSPQLTPETTP